MSEFNESKHPRDEKGKFTEKPNEASKMSVNELEKQQKLEIDNRNEIEVVDSQEELKK